MVYSPPFSRYQRTAYCCYYCYCGLPPMDIIFSCPDTITLITVAKTLTIANPGCFPWTSQANNYSPNRKCPSDNLPPESSWVRDSPRFSSIQPQLWGVRFAVGTQNQGECPPGPPGLPPPSWPTQLLSMQYIGGIATSTRGERKVILHAVWP